MLTNEQMPKIRPCLLGDDVTGPRVYELLEDWIYPDHPLGPILLKRPFFSDLASIPKYVPRWVISPSGYLFLAGFVHDYLYKNQFFYVEKRIGPKYLEVVDPPFAEPTYIKYWTDRKRADEIFKEIANISYPKQKKMTALATGALVVGGWAAWNDHRKNDQVVSKIGDL